MNVTDLASYRRVASYRRRDDRAKELALWPAFKALYLDLCATGHDTYDQKVLRKLWEDYCADLPRAISRRAMMGEL